MTAVAASSAQTLAQKLIARASGRERVAVGEIVTCGVDLAMFHDSSGPRRLQPMLEELGATVGCVTPLTTLACARENGVKTQYVYGCRLLTMDPGLRCGPEFEFSEYQRDLPMLDILEMSDRERPTR